MQKLFYLTIAATMLGIAACAPEYKDTQKPPVTQTPAQTTAESNAGTPVAPAVSPAAKPAAPDASGVLTQEQGLALATKSGCLACHKIDTDLLGPALKAIGAKYKDDAQAAQTIAANIKKGGVFGWKRGFMPPRGGRKVSDADIDSLASYIASLK